MDKTDHSHFFESKWFIAAIYTLCATTFLTAWRYADLSAQPLGLGIWLFSVLASLAAVFLFSVSLLELVSYFVFIPSLKTDSHIFATVHSNQLLHPLTSSLVLAAMVSCILSAAVVAWLLWILVLVGYVLQTSSIVKRIRSEQDPDSLGATPQSLLGLLAYLIFGAEIVTMAAGAKGIAPWKLKSLPEDTWIIDVRTPTEFQWNKLYGAQNFPWGTGLVEASRSVSRNRPILVTCLSGHRSPPVAVMLRRLGFENVYNLNWGLLYLILLQRGKSGSGVFDLTRPNRSTAERGKDYKGISYGYIASALIILILAPVEAGLAGRLPGAVQKAFGVLLGGSGILVAWLAFKALGRNFRVFAAPRRSGTLIETGVYSKVRHPMYTAVIVGFAGYVIYWGSLWSVPFWMALTTLYVIKAVKEEQGLMQRYPHYREYISRTKRFVPHLF